MAKGDLTATAFLVLGMLATREHSAYEIAEQVGRGLDEVWPRADRQRYNAPKRLLELGLVDARTEATGRRTRTVYTITDAGREVLAAWLATPPRKAALEIEGIVRLILADQGSIDDLRRTLEVVREQARASRAQFLAFAAFMAQPSGGTFPDRRHVLTLANRFMVDHFANIADWATWALAEVEGWPDTTTPVHTDRARTSEILEQILAEAAAEAEAEAGSATAAGPTAPGEPAREAQADGRGSGRPAREGVTTMAGSSAAHGEAGSAGGARGRRAADGLPTRRELYDEARRRGLPGRSTMTREELARALGHR